MTNSEIAQLLAVCSAAFPHVTVTKETAAVYAEMLADLEFEQALRGLRRVLATSQYFPSIAALREAYIAVSGHRPPSLDEAWREVIQAAKSVGASSMPKWSHEAIADAVAALGWRDICMSDNATALRAHFFKVYDHAAKAVLERALPMIARPAIEP